MMTRQQRIRMIFDEAVRHAPQQRTRFVKEACAGDEALLAECEVLVTAFEAGGEDDLQTTTGPLIASSSRRSEAPPDSLTPGQIFGPYQIVRLLGRGGMGEVYEADHIIDGRRVALKLLQRSSPTSRERQRFLREGRLAASISHPNVVYILGTEEIEGRQVIAMELLLGGTLLDRVETSGPLGIAEAVAATLQVAAGLAAALDQGILHRDVKPANCFVDSRERIKIGDFGLSIPSAARQETALTEAGIILGSPPFCSPEQLQGEALDHRCDIYSVGATLYFLLTGQAPFRDPNLVKLITKVVHDPPVPPRTLRPEIPAGLERILLQCLEKEPAKRPPSYEALRNALQVFSARLFEPAPPSTRLIAGLIDFGVILGVWRLCLVPAATWAGVLSPAVGALVNVTIGSLVVLAYFAAFERWRGGSIGKGICGITVESATPTVVRLPQTLGRAVLAVVIVLLLPAAASSVITSEPTRTVVPNRGRVFPAPVNRQSTARLSPWSLAGLMLLFSTARRRNGYRGLHELLSKTRTVGKRTRQASGRSAGSAAPVEVARGPMFGRYRLAADRVAEPDGSRFVEGFDEALHRPVWIHVLPHSSPAISPARRNLDRPLRLRWLGGRRTAAEAWDVYERPAGKPLSAVPGIVRPVTTMTARLAELAREISDSASDSTLGWLAVDRLWITSNGVLKILDASPPANGQGVAGTRPNQLPEAQAFLYEAAERLLQLPPEHKCVSGPLPRPLTELLRCLQTHSFATFADVVAACEQTAAKDLELTPMRRAVPAAAATVLLALVVQGNFGAMVDGVRTFRTVGLHAQFDSCLDTLFKIEAGQLVDPQGKAKPAAGKCIAALSRAVDGWALERWKTDSDNRRLIDESLARYPDSDWKDGQAIVGALPGNRNRTWDFTENDTGVHYATTYALMTVRRITAAGLVLTVLAAALFRRGLAFRALGIEVLTEDGRLAGRWRAAMRGALTWMPLMLGALLTILTCPKPNPPLLVFGAARVALAFAPLSIACIVSIYGIRHPTRGLPERLSGTWLTRS